DLSVETEPTTMSFGVQHLPRRLEYCGSSLSQLFAQRSNLLNPRFLRMLRQIDRFNREAGEALSGDQWSRFTLEQYAEARRYGDDFLDLYLLPMSSAVWSTRLEDIRHYPIVTLLRFFRNHGLLGGLSGHHQWRTVRGGSRMYVERLTREFSSRIRTGTPVARVRRSAEGVTLRLKDGSAQHFDKVILACHADEALALLEEPTEDERRLLGAFRYQKNVATLHTDPSVMPKKRRAWAAWNYRIDTSREGLLRSTTIYWMNALQRVSERCNYFVSIDDPGLIDPSTILRTIVYHHPIFDMEAIDAQAHLGALNRRSPDQDVYFCGSWFGHGFHEDALSSAIEVSSAIEGRACEGAAA
ncbi:MAG TPA: FAD-dependent oxidoreductase, partial [Thermoanaerobaculia bacterium]|nr:FAD-dependent oxidoreductase [Thermoanaerobaculia bacterium]